MTTGRKKKESLPGIIRRLGPGLITGASDDDPSGITTYAQAGAAFGPAFLWTALFTWPLMVSIQLMCARIGMVTRKGLMGVIKQYYPEWVSWIILLLTVPSIVLNISADLAAVGAVGNMLLPGIPSFLFSLLGSALLLYAIVKWNYHRIFRVLKWLCLALFCYLLIPFITETNWEQALKNTFVPRIEWKPEYILMLTGILGTTISPYLFFWQTNMEVEDLRKKHLPHGKKSFTLMDRDVRLGMALSNITFFFIILTSASVLNSKGVTEIQTVSDAAMALQPLAGDAAYLLFAIGVIGTGALAIPVLAATLAYMAAETFHWNEGLNKRYKQAPKFYRVIIAAIVIALIINLTGFSAVQLLIWAAVFNGIVSPPLIAIIMVIANNKEIMNRHKNSLAINMGGAISLLLMSLCVILLFVFW